MIDPSTGPLLLTALWRRQRDRHRGVGALEMTRTARQIIETRLGRSLGPVATMPQDLRRALYLLALQLVRMSP